MQLHFSLLPQQNGNHQFKMASTSSAESSTPPLTIGCSALPKIPLSHRWVINDVEIFLSKTRSLKSCSFCTPLPLKSFKKAFWTLSLQRKVASTEKYLHLSLYHDNAATSDCRLDDEDKYQSSTVAISDCSVSVLNLDTDEILFSSTAPNVECEIGGKKKTASMLYYNKSQSLSQLCVSVKFCHCADVSKYIFNDTLAVQVNATILCYTDPTETLEEGTSSIPLDNIRKELHGLFREKFLADVTIKCGDQEFQAHKVILASQSPVFKRMLVSDMMEGRSNLIEIPDIEPDVMRDLLAYIYTGSAPHLSRLAKDLLNAANKYELPRLFAMCEDKLLKKLKVGNVVETLLWANFLSAKLKGACLRFIHLHPTEVKSTSGWKHLKDNAEDYSSLLVEIMDFAL